MAAGSLAKYQFVLQFAADGATDMDALGQLEEDLADALTDGAEIDDTDVSGEAVTISIMTGDPQETFDEAIEVVEKQEELELTIAAYRPRRGGEFSVLYPEDYDGEFVLE